jgi:hypothetical protein
MTTTKYSYNKEVNPSKLRDEISTSSITIAVDYINGTTSTTDVFMKAALSPLEETALDDLVAQHTNTPTENLEPMIAHDGATLIREQTSPIGWYYQLYGILFKTATEGSALKKLADGSSSSQYLIEGFYDEGGNALSGVDVATRTCRTVIEWEPDWSYELLGGHFHQKTSPPGEVILNVTAIPDLPRVYGGSLVFVQSCDLNHIGPDAGLEINAHSIQRMNPDPNYHTNKLQFSVCHASGLQHDIFIGLEIYREK